MCDCFECHIDGNQISNNPGYSSGWLWNNIDGVDKRMCQTCNCICPEEH